VTAGAASGKDPRFSTKNSFFIMEYMKACLSMAIKKKLIIMETKVKRPPVREKAKEKV
jgi:hypothetical protein